MTPEEFKRKEIDESHLSVLVSRGRMRELQDKEEHLKWVLGNQDMSNADTWWAIGMLMGVFLIGSAVGAVIVYYA